MQGVTAALLTAVLCTVFTGCRPEAETEADIFDKTLYAPLYASGFSILGAEGKESSVLRITSPWQGADSTVMQIFVERGGEKAPASFNGQVLAGNAHRIVAMSSTNIAMLDAMGMADRIKGVSGIGYITNPSIQASRDSIADVGFSGNINYELLLSTNPDIVLLYGVTAPSGMESKLEELGIPYVYVGDYVEDSPLGKAEWMVALAELTGLRDKGIEAFMKIPERYNLLKDQVSALTTAKPEVMLNIPYSDSWFMPSAQSYMARLINDAGGSYVYKADTGNTSVPISLEKAYRLASEADIWLNTGDASSLDELKKECPKFTGIKCIREGTVYNNTLRSTPEGGNDFYESAVVRPDLLLRDLVKIFHPELVAEDFVYYRKLH